MPREAWEWGSWSEAGSSGKSQEAGRGLTFQSVASLWGCLAVHREISVPVGAEPITSLALLTY
jgi:hypothetical protein